MVQSWASALDALLELCSAGGAHNLESLNANPSTLFSHLFKKTQPVKLMTYFPLLPNRQ